MTIELGYNVDLEVFCVSFIECVDLTHIYNAGMENELLAVENVNINIEEGELFGAFPFLRFSFLLLF